MEDRDSVAVTNLRYSYEKGTEILHGISASFTPGKITALIGANGCGKSTLLNLIAGILKPEDGEIVVGDKNIAQMSRNALAKRIAVVHQKNAVPGDMTVEKLVEAGRTPHKQRFRPLSKKDEEAVREAMIDTDILHLAERSVAALSGGQMQRVWLAMALAQETEILLLDEITTYLDVHYQLELLHLIRELNQRKKRTVIMVLHDINLAMEFCDEVVVMKNGVILAQGDIKEAITTEVLDEAFQISSQMVSVEETKYCIFQRKAVS